MLSTERLLAPHTSTLFARASGGGTEVSWRMISMRVCVLPVPLNYDSEEGDGWEDRLTWRSMDTCYLRGVETELNCVALTWVEVLIVEF